jgi:hypothetical protein
MYQSPTHIVQKNTYLANDVSILGNEVVNKLLLIKKLNLPDVLIDIVKEFTYYNEYDSYIRLHMKHSVYSFFKQILSYENNDDIYYDGPGPGVVNVQKIFPNEVHFPSGKSFAPSNPFCFDICFDCGNYIRSISRHSVCQCYGEPIHELMDLHADY